MLSKDYGLIVPLICEEGLSAFSLQVIVIPTCYPKYSQFPRTIFLLDKSFKYSKNCKF
jgi:hypothetical protein